MLQEAGAKLSAFHRNLYVKVASKSEGSEAAAKFSEGSADEEVELEAASGLEPEIEVLQGKATPGPTDAKASEARRSWVLAAQPRRSIHRQISLIRIGLVKVASKSTRAGH